MTIEDQQTILSLKEYVDARVEALEKMQQSTMNSHLHSDEVAHGALHQEIMSTKELLSFVQTASQRAADKFEAQQLQNNAAQNEWRGTLNDFKGTLVSRVEHERFYSEFAAFKLEQAQLTAAQLAVVTTKKEEKQDWKSVAAIIVSLATAFLVYVKTPSPNTASPPPSVIYVQPGTPTPAPTTFTDQVQRIAPNAPPATFTDQVQRIPVK